MNATRAEPANNVQTQTGSKKRKTKKETLEEATFNRQKTEELKK
jgi:hypothetical protein